MRVLPIMSDRVSRSCRKLICPCRESSTRICHICLFSTLCVAVWSVSMMILGFVGGA